MDERYIYYHLIFIQAMSLEKSVSRRVLLGTVGGITGGLVMGGVAGWLLKPVEHEVRTVTHTQTVGAPGVQTLTVTERITETLTRTLTAGAPREKVTITVNWFPGPESDAVAPIIDWWNKNMSDETGVRVELTLFGRAEHF